MNILSIGNSFSQDAQRYLHNIAKSAGENITCVNLFIGGCSLHTHFANISNDAKLYDLQYNGENTHFKVSVKEALLNREWDFITIQQASHFSYDYNTYQPYANKLVEYIKTYAPKAKILIHQTWGYESNSERITKQGFEKYDDMFTEVKNSYAKLAEEVKADGVIPCGQTMSNMMKNGLEKVHRDCFHADFGYGRFALALTWFEYLTGKDCRDVKFTDFDVEVSDKEIEIAKNSAHEAIEY